MLSFPPLGKGTSLPGHLCLGATASIWQPSVFASSWDSKPTAPPQPPLPWHTLSCSLLASSGKPLAFKDLLPPPPPPPSLASPISPQVQLVTTVFPLAGNGQSCSACWEERKPEKGGGWAGVIQMSSWIELLKAASSLPQRGHTTKEGEKFGVVSTAGTAGGNSCGWPGRLSQPS